MSNVELIAIAGKVKKTANLKGSTNFYSKVENILFDISCTNYTYLVLFFYKILHPTSVFKLVITIDTYLSIFLLYIYMLNPLGSLCGVPNKLLLTKY